MSSFSREVKSELCALDGAEGHCLLAELSAFIDMLGRVDADIAAVPLEREEIVVRFCWLAKQVTGNIPELLSAGLYATSLPQGILAAMLNQGGALAGLEGGTIIRRQCCKRAYVRGAFLACASLTDPQKHYHLEFSNHDSQALAALSSILASFGVACTTAKRKGISLLYTKDSESIVDILNIAGAHKSLMRLENVRVLKDVRNDTNRRVNFETANLDKTVQAALNQAEDIEYIIEKVGLGILSPGLAQVARIRLKYHDASLKEIGEMLVPPIGKSGVNHRLRKISAIATAMKGEQQ